MVKELTADRSGATNEGGLGVLWSTAYLDEAEKCDTVFLLNEGRLLYAGTPGDLTGRVDGRALRLFGPAQGRRALLERVLDREDVVDGTIQDRKSTRLNSSH